MRKKCYIFAYADHVFQPKVDFQKEDFYICADCGYKLAKEMGISCNLAIGDFDSMKEEELPKELEKIVLPCKKDETDAMAAINEAIKRGFQEVVIVGGVSTDIAHTYANITLLKYADKNHISASIISEKHEIYYVKNGKLTLKNKKGIRVSIFSYSEISTDVTLMGFEYELRNAVLINSNPIGVSNMATQNECIIEVKTGELIVMIDTI